MNKLESLTFLLCSLVKCPEGRRAYVSFFFFSFFFVAVVVLLINRDKILVSSVKIKRIIFSSSISLSLEQQQQQHQQKNVVSVLANRFDIDWKIITVCDTIFIILFISILNKIKTNRFSALFFIFVKNTIFFLFKQFHFNSRLINYFLFRFCLLFCCIFLLSFVFVFVFIYLLFTHPNLLSIYLFLSISLQFS